MAWGRSSIPRPPPPPKSALRQLLPLIILFVFLAGFAFVGYHLYLTFQQISKNTSEKMQSKNVVFSKDGLKVGVKQKSNENYVDTTQSFFVKAWNLSTFPAYKSRLWNKPQEGNAEARRPYSRTASGAQ